jgi:hypothetical protein
MVRISTTVISTLNDEQLRSIAGKVAKVFVALRDVPNNGRFWRALGRHR